MAETSTENVILRRKLAPKVDLDENGRFAGDHWAKIVNHSNLTET
jgi:hypothetical protein